MSTSVLTANQLSCVRGARQLFHSISFSLSSGELLQVVGNNGVGKSSLLRIVAGLLQPTSGQVSWRDYQDIAYLGHALGLRPELTVLENILFSPVIIKNKLHISNCLEKWALLSFADKHCSSLSQGQQQRLALARLELLQKKIWIIDEPFSNLDADGVLQLEHIIKMQLNAGGCVLMSSHRRLFDSAEIAL